MTSSAVRNKRLRKDNRQAFLIILPFLIGFVLFSCLPILHIIRYAFTDCAAPNFRGFIFFLRIFTAESDFRMSIVNTFLLSFCKLPVEIPPALLPAGTASA